MEMVHVCKLFSMTSYYQEIFILCQLCNLTQAYWPNQFAMRSKKLIKILKVMSFPRSRLFEFVSHIFSLKIQLFYLDFYLNILYRQLFVLPILYLNLDNKVKMSGFGNIEDWTTSYIYSI